MGLGPMTGRAAGFCTGYSKAPLGNKRLFGVGARYGRGRGWRNRCHVAGFTGWTRAVNDYPFYAGRPYPYDEELSTKEELGILKNHSEVLKQQLNEVQDRINTLEKSQEEE